MSNNVTVKNENYPLQCNQKDLKSSNHLDLDVNYEYSELSTTHRTDFQAYPLSPSDNLGKKRQLMNSFLFQKISEDMARQEFRPRSPPTYISTTHDDFNIPEFDPEANLQPKFEYSVYLDPVITYWSENKRLVQGVSVPENATRNFHLTSRFSKPVWDQWNEAEINTQI